MKQLTDFEQKVLSDTISKYGFDPQIDMAIEEMSELIKALLKFRRTVKYSQDNPEPKRQNVLEEIADVEILLHQMKIIFDFRQEDIDKVVEYKLLRQYDRLSYSDAPRLD